jgi:hypothetical protein
MITPGSEFVWIGVGFAFPIPKAETFDVSGTTAARYAKPLRCVRKGQGRF